MAGTELSDLLEFAHGRKDLKNSDLVPVVSVNLGSGYNWNEFHAFYSPSRRRFFWASDSGCSCNSWHDNIHTIDDFENGSTRADVMAGLNRYFDDAAESRGYANANRVSALAEINSFDARRLS